MTSDPLNYDVHDVAAEIEEDQSLSVLAKKTLTREIGPGTAEQTRKLVENKEYDTAMELITYRHQGE